MARAEKQSYDIEELKSKYPSLASLCAPTAKAKERAWVYTFTEKPEAMEDFLADMIKQAYAKPGRIGQRPMPREEEVNLEALLRGDYTDDSIDKVLPLLVGQMSQRSLCTKISMNRRTLQLMMLPDGHPQKYHPDMSQIQRIADAVGKPAAYFVEWRQMAAMAAFVNLITERPGVATRIYRSYLGEQQKTPILKPIQGSSAW